MWQRLLSFLFLLSSISAQSFFYSYIDPCEQTVVRTNVVISGEQQGFQVTYYNRTKFFTLQEVLNGDLERWTQDVYNDFENLHCYQILCIGQAYIKVNLAIPSS